MEKLTDNEIIKVLECCEGVDGISYCNGCPLFGDDNCVHIISMEAKGLINRQNEEIDRLLKAIEDKHCVYEKRVVTEAIITVQNQPTADVVEVKHGKWENFEIPHMMRCSECGVSDLDLHRTKFAFCPYCGAKMDGKDNNVPTK